MAQQDVFERVLASLQDAALDDSLWPVASARLDEACGATGNGLVVCEGSGENAAIVHAAFFSRGRPCEDLQREYVDAYYRLDERVPRLRRLPAGRLARVRSLFTEDELKTSPVYNKSLRRMGARNGFNVRLDGPDGCHIFWGTADPSAPGDWQPDQIRMMQRLLPHIRHFVCARRALAGAGALNASLSGLLDNTRLGVVHLDLHGRIFEASDRARVMLRQPGGLSEKEGFLRAWLPADDTALQRLLAGALPAAGRGLPTGGTLAVRRQPPLASLVVHVDPLTGYRKGFSLAGIGARVALVEPASRPCISPGLVARAFGLTPGESRVAAMLAEGRTVGEIASATGRQKSAVYWLLRQTYAKLGISRQVDLVRRVLSLSEAPKPQG